MEGNVFGLYLRVAGGFGKGNRDNVVGMDFVVGLDRFVIDSHKALMDAALDLGARHIGQAIHQELINPHKALLGISNDAVVFKKQIILFFQ